MRMRQIDRPIGEGLVRVGRLGLRTEGRPRECEVMSKMGRWLTSRPRPLIRSSSCSTVLLYCRRASRLNPLLNNKKKPIRQHRSFTFSFFCLELDLLCGSIFFSLSGAHSLKLSLSHPRYTVTNDSQNKKKKKPWKSRWWWWNGVSDDRSERIWRRKGDHRGVSKKLQLEPILDWWWVFGGLVRWWWSSWERGGLEVMEASKGELLEAFGCRRILRLFCALCVLWGTLIYSRWHGSGSRTDRSEPYRS